MTISELQAISEAIANRAEAKLADNYAQEAIEYVERRTAEAEAEERREEFAAKLRRAAVDRYREREAANEQQVLAMARYRAGLRA